MGKFIVVTVLMIVADGSVWASEPKSVLSTKKATPRVQPNEFQRVLARLAERDRRQKRDAIELLAVFASPQPFTQISKVLIDPNERMTTKLKESEDLREAAREMQRFWMNNQPAVRNLKGAIGP